MDVSKRVLIAAGGTGGHVFPGLAIAKALGEKGCEVHWLGTKAGIESKLVPDASLELHIIGIEGVRGRGLKALFLAPFLIIGAVWKALQIVRDIEPCLVIGMGGFVAGPGGVAARLAGVPLVIHEQNAVAGTTNKLLARVAAKVLVAFPNVFPDALWVGNPVRSEFYRESLEKEYRDFVRVLVVGGSRGARALNELIIATLAGDAELQSQLAVFHQTGEQLLAETRTQYGARGITLADKGLQQLAAGSVLAQPFINNMAEAYHWADLVICRAGALTISELAASGVASILVPYPYAIDDHQTENGKYLVKEGAAVLVQQNQLDSQTLVTQLKEYIADKSMLKTMGVKARQCAKPHAVSQFTQVCESLIKQDAA